MTVVYYTLKRLLMLGPQLLAISLVTFFLIRLIPGNPAAVIAGPLATPETLAGIEARLGLDKPITTQYVIFLQNSLHGDFGTSWYTSQPVLQDLLVRAPATLELITWSLLLAALIGIPLGLASALRPHSLLSRATHAYGLLGGAFPDFFFALLFIYVLFFKLNLLPAPMGRLPANAVAPPHVTGFYLFDSAVNGDWATFRAAALQLIMPVGTLAFVAAGAIVKMTNATVRDVLDARFMAHCRALGMTSPQIARYALRNSLSPVVTVIANTYSYALGGAVLIETVFAWGGMGQYAVQSVLQADYAPLQAFVLFVAAFNLLIYLAVDLIYLLIDPRVSY